MSLNYRAPAFTPALNPYAPAFTPALNPYAPAFQVQKFMLVRIGRRKYN